MNKNVLIVGGGIAAVLVVGGLLVVGSVISTSNTEVSLRSTIETKQKDNTSEFDNMWKSISQVAQVTDAQKNALIEIFNGYASARSGNNKGGSLANWIHESVPNVDTSTFNNLQNIIVSKRDGFVMRQKELLDLSREHTILLRRFPSGIILTTLGRREIPVTIVTSTRTAETFKTGKDDDVNVFNNK